jgi:hypothetical protein
MASAGKSSGATPIGRRGPKTGSNVAERTIPAQLESGTAAMAPAGADTPDLGSTPDPGSTPDLNFEPSAVFESDRTTSAPAPSAQQEALKALEHFGRYHYSVAGDYLEWGVAQAKAIFTPCTPAEHVASQITLATQFGEKLQGRVREFVSLASETRASFNELVGEATARFAETIKRFA